MQLHTEQLSATRIKLTISASHQELLAAKDNVTTRLGSSVKVPGFRPGKAPTTMVEKYVDQSVLQSQVMDDVINALFYEAVQTNNIRPTTQPDINITKFVPFTTLEFTAELDAVGEITLPDYTKFTSPRPDVVIKDEDIEEVIENLRQRAAVKKPVTRAAKAGDEVVIDFMGVDAENGEPIQGADGKAYPLVLGSDSFIPGFESELIGTKSSATPTFTLTFPSDYGVQALQNKKVTFSVTVHSVQALELPEVDTKFVKSVGPFKTVDELKTDISKQLKIERQRDANQQYVNEIIAQIADKATVAIPDSLINDEVDRMEQEEKQNLLYRGQTWEEHLTEEGITHEAHRERQWDGAQQRVKAGILLGQIANDQNITVTPEELEMRIQLLKGQYTEEHMQAELDKPESRRDIHSRMMTEKTFDYLLSLASDAK